MLSDLSDAPASQESFATAPCDGGTPSLSPEFPLCPLSLVLAVPVVGHLGDVIELGDESTLCTVDTGVFFQSNEDSHSTSSSIDAVSPSTSNSSVTSFSSRIRLLCLQNTDLGVNICPGSNPSTDSFNQSNHDCSYDGVSDIAANEVNDMPNDIINEQAIAEVNDLSVDTINNQTTSKVNSQVFNEITDPSFDSISTNNDLLLNLMSTAVSPRANVADGSPVSTTTTTHDCIVDSIDELAAASTLDNSAVNQSGSVCECACQTDISMVDESVIGHVSTRDAITQCSQSVLLPVQSVLSDPSVDVDDILRGRERHVSTLLVNASNQQTSVESPVTSVSNNCDTSWDHSGPLECTVRSNCGLRSGVIKQRSTNPSSHRGSKSFVKLTSVSCIFDHSNSNLEKTLQSYIGNTSDSNHSAANIGKVAGHGYKRGAPIAASVSDNASSVCRRTRAPSSSVDADGRVWLCNRQSQSERPAASSSSSCAPPDGSRVVPTHDDIFLHPRHRRDCKKPGHSCQQTCVPSTQREHSAHGGRRERGHLPAAEDVLNDCRERGNRPATDASCAKMYGAGAVVGERRRRVSPPTENIYDTRSCNNLVISSGKKGIPQSTEDIPDVRSCYNSLIHDRKTGRNKSATEYVRHAESRDTSVIVRRTRLDQRLPVSASLVSASADNVIDSPPSSQLRRLPTAETGRINDTCWSERERRLRRWLDDCESVRRARLTVPGKSVSGDETGHECNSVFNFPQSERYTTAVDRPGGVVWRPRRFAGQKRRSRVAYTSEEVLNLCAGVKRYGWDFNAIRLSYPFHSQRTTVDLYDKYRHMKPGERDAHPRSRSSLLTEE